MDEPRLPKFERIEAATHVLRLPECRSMPTAAIASAFAATSVASASVATPAAVAADARFE